MELWKFSWCRPKIGPYYPFFFTLSGSGWNPGRNTDILWWSSTSFLSTPMNICNFFFRSVFQLLIEDRTTFMGIKFAEAEYPCKILWRSNTMKNCTVEKRGRKLMSTDHSKSYSAPNNGHNDSEFWWRDKYLKNYTVKNSQLSNCLRLLIIILYEQWAPIRKKGNMESTLTWSRWYGFQFGRRNFNF